MKVEKIFTTGRELFTSRFENKKLSSKYVQNPFGLSFKGNVIQADVFESSSKPNKSTFGFKSLDKLYDKIFPDRQYFRNELSKHSVEELEEIWSNLIAEK